MDSGLRRNDGFEHFFINMEVFCTGLSLINQVYHFSEYKEERTNGTNRNPGLNGSCPLVIGG